MPKRFTATEKWLDPWFCGLAIIDRLFWIYLLDNCDHSGIWQVNKLLVETYFPGYFVEAQTFGDRVRVLNPQKWLITKFVDFQYGTLNPANRAHASVLQRLKKEGAYKGLTRSLLAPKDKDKDKDKEKKLGGMGDFESLWKDYPRKRGKDDALRHFKSQVKTQNDFEDIQKALKHYNEEIKKNEIHENYILHGSTWFNNRWRDYIDAPPPTAAVKPYKEDVPPEADIPTAEEVRSFVSGIAVKTVPK